jgi:hypothetical protein
VIFPWKIAVLERTLEKEAGDYRIRWFGLFLEEDSNLSPAKLPCSALEKQGHSNIFALELCLQDFMHLRQTSLFLRHHHLFHRFALKSQARGNSGSETFNIPEFPP